MTLWKTHPYLRWQRTAAQATERRIDLSRAYDGIRQNYYLFVNIFLLMAIVAVS